MRNRSDARWAIAIAGLFFTGAAITLAIIRPARFMNGANDFVQLYAGAKLVGTPDLYSVEANRLVQLQTTGGELEGVYYSRPPFYAFLLKPLGHMPYRAAYWTFQVLSLFALAAFLYLYGGELPELLVLAAMSLPVLFAIYNGQDITIVLALAGGAMLLAKKGRDFAAGLLLSLCAIKFHLFVLTPLALIARGRWRMLAGGTAGAAALLALSFAAAGMHWPSQYFRLAAGPDIHPHPELMPNVHGLTAGLPHGRGIEIALMGLIVIAVAWLCWRSTTLESAFAYSLIGSLLVSYHCYVHDYALLLVALALLLRSEAPKVVRALAGIAATPLPYIAFLMSEVNLTLTGWLFGLLAAGLIVKGREA